MIVACGRVLIVMTGICSSLWVALSIFLNPIWSPSFAVPRSLAMLQPGCV